MGFIEELRRQKAAEEAETQRRIAEANQRSQKAEEESVKKQERARVEFEARAKALRESVIPQLATELAQLTGKRITSAGDRMEIVVDDTKVNWEKHEKRLKVVAIAGQVDGSVRIGDRTLNSFQARNAGTVESALEKAYKHPSERFQYVEPGFSGQGG